MGSCVSYNELLKERDEKIKELESKEHIRRIEDIETNINNIRTTLLLNVEDIQWFKILEHFTYASQFYHSKGYNMLVLNNRIDFIVFHLTNGDKYSFGKKSMIESYCKDKTIIMDLIKMCKKTGKVQEFHYPITRMQVYQVSERTKQFNYIMEDIPLERFNTAYFLNEKISSLQLENKEQEKKMIALQDKLNILVEMVDKLQTEQEKYCIINE
jgi:hypothetical protein